MIHSRPFFHLLSLWVVLITACTPQVKDAVKVDELPIIYPDYMGVTIPAGIAPLNFNVIGEEVKAVDIVARGGKKGKIHVTGRYANFPLRNWHELTYENMGDTISITVCLKEGGRWIQYADFPIYVSNYPLEDFGLTYRRIPPGYEVGGNIGTYQRDIHTFKEYPLMTETAVPGRCMNCHISNRNNPDEFLLQVRHEQGGTMIQKQGRQYWLDTKTDSTKAAGSYASWHPAGDYVAFAVNSVRQSFFVGTYKPIEVFHEFSDIVLLDTRTNELVTDERLMTPDWLEIFPAFSADGRTLFYSTSQNCRKPSEFMKVKCSLVSIPFNAETGTFGTEVDTLLNGPATDMSYVMPRPSYDGRWLMYVRCGRSDFPIVQRDADLWLMNLETKENKPLVSVNSEETESGPCWSSDSHWFVFASKREDAMYTRLYLACVDSIGNATKPFLLPQRNPQEYYHKLFDAYNVAGFTQTKVDFDIREAQRHLFGKERIKVKMRNK